MAECIERGAAYLLAKKICDAIDSEDFQRLNFGMRILDWIDDIPAADVEPVVRCRDCKWTKTDEMDKPTIYCMQWDRWETPPDGFCWLGEKGEES